MTAEALIGVEFDPLKDRSYRDARLGPDVAAFLAWLELGGASPITVENYERALAVVCRMYPQTEIRDLTDLQLGQVFRRFPVKSRRVRVAPYRRGSGTSSRRATGSAKPLELLRPHIGRSLPKPSAARSILACRVVRCSTAGFRLCK